MSNTGKIIFSRALSIDDAFDATVLASYRKWCMLEHAEFPEEKWGWVSDTEDHSKYVGIKCNDPELAIKFSLIHGKVPNPPR